MSKNNPVQIFVIVAYELERFCPILAYELERFYPILAYELENFYTFTLEITSANHV